ncbi:hypothetical protein AAG906_000901 [Vitis piasezkii]
MFGRWGPLRQCRRALYTVGPSESCAFPPAFPQQETFDCPLHQFHPSLLHYRYHCLCQTWVEISLPVGKLKRLSFVLASLALRLELDLAAAPLEVFGTVWFSEKAGNAGRLDF